MNAQRVLSVALLMFAVAMPSSVWGQAVQLPTYSHFSAGTTVSVPDRGSVYLGGVKRARSGSSEFGVPLTPFRNRSIGMERSASSTRVSATIHDFQAMDEYLLSQPTRTFPRGYRGEGALAGARQPAPRWTRGSATAVDTWQARLDRARSSSAGQAVASVAELRARRRPEKTVRQTEAEQYFARGKSAEARGKLNVAKIYYQQAARRAEGELKAQIRARLDLVSTVVLAENRR